MTSTVSSQMGRRWLTAHRPATTAFEVEEGGSAQLETPAAGNIDVIEKPRAEASQDTDQAVRHPLAASFQQILGDTSSETINVALSGTLNDSFKNTPADAMLESIAQQPAMQNLKVPKPTVETPSATPVARFGTEAIFDQLHGTDGFPPVETIHALELPTVNNPISNANFSSGAEHQIVFVNVPNVADDAQKVMADTSGMKIVGLYDDAESLASPSEESTGDPSPTSTRVDAANSDTTGGEEDVEINTLVDSIFERFPLAASSVLLFVGTELNPHVDETCARVAAAIAERNVGNVLLVDADVQGRRLTRASGLTAQSGYAECINRDQPWQEKIVSQNGSSFGFLPVGTCDMDRWNAQQLLRTTVAEMKGTYQFVCVSAGSTHAKHSKLWFDVCDGTYLVVSLQSSNETYAQSSVKELQAHGARLLGCVVTDAE